MLGRVPLALAVFIAKRRKKDVTCMVQIHEVAKKHFLLEKEPVLRKKEVRRSRAPMRGAIQIPKKLGGEKGKK